MDVFSTILMISVNDGVCQGFPQCDFNVAHAFRNITGIPEQEHEFVHERRNRSYFAWYVRGKGSARLGLRRLVMSNQHSFISADQFHPDPYTQSRNAERTLNAAIVHAEISRSYEEYLEIFDEFYADDIEGSGETMKEPLRGKERVRSLLFSFLVPVHVMAEVGGVSISIRETAIPGDAIDQTHSAWTLELVGVSGELCTVSWRILRKWNEL